jgi:hypothetical protein
VPNGGRSSASGMLKKIMDRPMNVIVRFRSASAFLFVLLVVRPSYPQSETDRRNWDFAVWAAGATGEENTNSFTEAQILTAGVFVGKELTNEVGSGWRRGRFEYGFSMFPLFRQFRAESIYGGGFEPVILRWNSSLHSSHIAPYIELAGGGVIANTNLPAGDTSNFNFTARGGGGIQVFTKRRQFVDTACRWSHISNANLGMRNTEFNGVQVSVGYHWIR